MNRRELMISASALAAGATVLPRMAFADGTTIQWVTSSDQNIIDFWTNVVKPKFEAANPGLTVNLVDGGDMSGLIALASRGLAALQTHKDPQFDFLEGFDTRLPDGGLKAGLWTDFSKANLSNYSKINPLALDIPTNFPYRGSQVLLAYDGTKIDKAKAPTTWPDLVAWIKANPGQFIYNRPDKGGSGANFVIRAIYEANGKDPSLFKVDNYDKAKADEMLAKGFALLKELEPYLMGKGQYTSGNTQSIQLLSQSAVAMIPAWSDQSLSALTQGVLPETTGLVQLADLGFPGGFTWCAVPTNDANHDAALKLCDFLLTEEVQSAILTQLGGFPGVSWDYVSDDLRKKFEAIVPKSIPVFPQGDWTKAVNDGWYRNVATNLQEGA
jgi:putative spermidine/putrescine transport system substrate-binding protein